MKAVVRELLLNLVQSGGEDTQRFSGDQRYSPPATHCDRVIRHEVVSIEAKVQLTEHRANLDQVALLHVIQQAPSELTASYPLSSSPLRRRTRKDPFLRARGRRVGVIAGRPDASSTMLLVGGTILDGDVEVDRCERRLPVRHLHRRHGGHHPREVNKR